jgi:hypothetical protein
MPEVTTPAHKAGDFFVDYEEKVLAGFFGLLGTL